MKCADYFGAHRDPQHDAHELDRARQRVGIAGLFAVISAGQAWWAGVPDQVPWVVALLAAAYAAGAVFHLKVQLAKRPVTVVEQYALLVLDSAVSVFCMVAVPVFMAPLYPVLMVLIVRCGMRYGLRTLWLSWGAAALTAAVLMPFSPYWLSELEMLRSFVVMMLIIPLFMGPLVTRLHRMHAELRAAAGTDPLTGLGNRRMLAEHLRFAQERSGRDGTMLAVVLLDLDNFKAVNDLHGHARGDELLGRVATAIRGCARTGDFAARVGGDEFVLLVENLPPQLGHARAEALARRLIEAVRAAAGPLATEVGVSASAGVYCWARSQADLAADSVDPLVMADRAMYAAKRAGKSQVVLVPQ